MTLDSPAPAAKEEYQLEEQKPVGSHADGLPTPQGQAIDPAIEARVVRKLDCRVPVLLGALYLLSFLDRSNIGNAKIAGMEEDLELTGDRYTWLLTIFYISYILFQWQGMMWKLIPPHRWATFVVFAWGVVATCQTGVQSWGGEMALRFLLGATEAGFGPGVPYLLSFFYRRKEIGLRCGIFLSAAPLANTFAGALAYGITSGHPKFSSWRLLFLVEGLPTVLMAPVAWFFLPDSPAHARFLTEEEKEIAKARGIQQVGELMYFSCNVSFSSLPVFLPTVLNDMGFTAIHAQGLTAPPYFLSFILTIFTTWVADRYQQRGLTIACLSMVGAIGYVLLATCESVAVRYFAVWLAAAGVFPAISNILPWVLNNQGSDTRRGVGIILLNLVGQCGPILGTRVFPESDKPRYVKGQAICAAFMAFVAFLALCLRALLVWENGRLDKKHGTTAEREAQRQEGKGEALTSEENYGADFRYVL